MNPSAHEFKLQQNIKTKKQLKKYIDTFNGDNNTLSILSELLNIDFYIFDQISQLPIEISSKSSNNIILLDTNPGLIGVYLDKELVAEGEGPSKQDAQQAAAEAALRAKGW